MKTIFAVDLLPFLAHFLFILAAWTLVIKFIFPLAYSLHYGDPLLEHVLWDFWWVIHIGLGWLIISGHRALLPVGLGASIAEIFIIVWKFSAFLGNPEWTIWRTNWFINKIFVLACFILLLVVLCCNYSILRNR